MSARRPWLTDSRWVLLWILFAAFLRFCRLGHPGVLTDEAFTYWRVCGSFDQLCRVLRPDGFVPLHYELEWLLVKLFGGRLWVLRLPGAVSGSFMPWAMFVLGRSVWDRRTGRTAAMLGAASAFLGFFSRDAKMYMPAWFAMTGAIAFAVVFARSGRRRDVLLCALLGIAAAGIHALTLIVLVLTPAVVYIFAHNRRRTGITTFWRRRLRLTAYGIVATAIMASGPGAYYLTFSRWFTEAGGLSGSRDDGHPAEHDNGLMWIGSWQSDRTPANTLLSCLSSYLVGYQWPDYVPSDSPEGAAKAEFWTTARPYQLAKLSLQGICVIAASGTVAVFFKCGRRWQIFRGRTAAAASLFVGVPLYLFYLRSFRELASPILLVPDTWHFRWALIPAGLLLMTVWTAGTDGLRKPSRQYWVRSAAWVGLAWAFLWTTWLIMQIDYAIATLAVRPGETVRWNHLWMPRYSGVVAPFLLVILAAAISRIPGKWLRGALLVGVIAINLLPYAARIFLGTEPPLAVLMQDALRSRDARTVVAVDWIQIGNQRWFPVLPKPAYDLVEAASELGPVPMSPPLFRAGNTWPYIPGPAIDTLLKSIRIVPARLASQSADLRHSTEITIWRRHSDPTPTPPSGWSLTSRQVYRLYDTWEWTESDSWQREIYHKAVGR